MPGDLESPSTAGRATTSLDPRFCGIGHGPPARPAVAIARHRKHGEHRQATRRDPRRRVRQRSIADRSAAAPPRPPPPPMVTVRPAPDLKGRLDGPGCAPPDLGRGAAPARGPRGCHALSSSSDPRPPRRCPQAFSAPVRRRSRRGVTNPRNCPSECQHLVIDSLHGQPARARSIGRTDRRASRSYRCRDAPLADRSARVRSTRRLGGEGCSVMRALARVARRMGSRHGPLARACRPQAARVPSGRRCTPPRATLVFAGAGDRASCNASQRDHVARARADDDSGPTREAMPQVCARGAARSRSAAAR